MSCESDLVRQRELADELWRVIQESSSMEEFADKLLVFALTLHQEVHKSTKSEQTNEADDHEYWPTN